MSSQICLKWNSFLSNIATSFESLWEEEGLVDVTLASDGQCLTAHKVILSASSPFFKKVFQTNPCQHPVIILQDVHFSELEALLIFIYKGEVNIEQKNLPALLKAAETLQIRGLSGGDIFAKESYKRLAELEQAVAEDAPLSKEETPKKKQKVSKQQNNSILEKALTPRISQSENTNESAASDQSGKDGEYMLPETLPNPVYHRLEMKIEPLEMAVDDLQKRSPIDKDPAERLDTGQADGNQGSSKPIVTVIAEARHTSPDPQTHRRDFLAVECSSFSRFSGLSKYMADPSSDLPNYSRAEQTSPDPQTHRTDSAVERFWNLSKYVKDSSSDLPNYSRAEQTLDQPESSNFLGHNPGVSQPSFPAFVESYSTDLSEEAVKGGPVYPPFPCPFCDRAYTSWGFRRRHIKAVHTISPSLNCKWCLQVLPTHAAWRRHVISAHNLSASDAHNGLLILEEAHMVLQIARPTRLDTLVNIIKQSSQQNCGHDSTQPDKD
ncbi:PREDICTED: GDNF-inducible zinc finger protein 1-like [Wasmannia auropunctata]|uniref:GDNF-inducible zinc finger protein 1-like n=1 Tax=Wasmannia auropunctata TaxID=64793 RepID=UPI0005EF8B7C|nr:PREDICTED: GDNF-inducible zinc finger protein 1-like [Wasmannia auropunctata]XP_011703370.1 PREDICTED: GDNF-inducible zinc finger protein 1-like [Wasmannia auropunctata]XP_011703372.1 PREDICTED: GDNF-inducible zinc finger protein 1-like [Wasmannia auropunctata]